MQEVVFEEPYTFIPPVRHARWVKACTYILKSHLRKAYGIQRWSIHHIDRMLESINQGHGVMLCPNHSRPSDPLSLGIISHETGQPVYTMASWHVFKQSALAGFMTSRLGGFSIYREGMDRAALNCAIDVLTTAERPLVIFPEGVITRTNQHLGELMDGPSFIARSAARKRKSISPDQKVVVHPVGLDYEFLGDADAATREILTRVETRLSMWPQDHLPTDDRVRQCARALLSLKEVEHMGQAQSGSLFERLQSLMDHMMHPLEIEWLKETKTGPIPPRVKNLRAAILPDMVAKTVTEKERQRRWKQLAAVYLAQQLSFYPKDYLDGDIRPERWLETVEQFEEDMTDVPPDTRPWHLKMTFGEAIEVSPKRTKTADGGDLLTEQIRDAMMSLIGDRRANDSRSSPDASAEDAESPARQSA